MYKELIESLRRIIERLSNPDVAMDVRDRNGMEHDRLGRFSKFSSVGHQEFHQKLSGAKWSNPPEVRWRVDVHPVEDYRNTKNFVTTGGSTFSINDGDIISVCRHTGEMSRRNGARGKELMEQAVAQGGNRLDSFDGNYAFYRKCGFEPISWIRFSKEAVSSEWNPSRDKPEDVIFFAYTGNKIEFDRPEDANAELQRFKTENDAFSGENAYDNAMKARDEFLKKAKKEQER